MGLFPYSYSLRPSFDISTQNHSNSKTLVTILTWVYCSPKEVHCCEAWLENTVRVNLLLGALATDDANQANPDYPYVPDDPDEPETLGTGYNCENLWNRGWRDEDPTSAEQFRLGDK